MRAAIDNEFELPAAEDYGGPPVTSKLIPGQTDASGEETWQSLLLDYKHRVALASGARERQFNDQDNERESPGHTSSMGRLTSENRTAQIEPVPEILPLSLTLTVNQCTRVSWLPLPFIDSPKANPQA